ncbi:hypothetical protein [Emticicia fontis]
MRVIKFQKLSQNQTTTLLLYFVFFILLAILFANVAHIFFLNLKSKGSSGDIEFSEWEKSLQIGISISGFLSLLVSIKIWQDTSKQEISQATISLFEKFRDEDFSKIRMEAWKIRNKWYLENNYKQEIIESSKKLHEEYDTNQFMQTMKPVRRLIEFYTILSQYKGNEDIVKRCRYFHYGYWRPFLYEIAKLHDEYNTPVTEFSNKYTMQYQEYIKGISYVETLKNMDRFVGFEGIKEDFRFHDFN